MKYLIGTMALLVAFELLMDLVFHINRDIMLLILIPLAIILGNWAGGKD